MLRLCARSRLASSFAIGVLFLVSGLVLASTQPTDSSSSSSSSAVHLPVGKDGAGEYTAATKGCFDVIATASPMVLEAISNQQQQQTGRAFHVADYGTADAGTSLRLLSQVVQEVRKKDANREVVIHYEDQVTNEWKSVFNHALGTIKVKDIYGNPIPTPYELGGVFLDACAISFHNQCYPTESIDLAISMTAMHWLGGESSAHNSLRGTEYMHCAQCPDGPPAAEQAQARHDWLRVLQARSKELVRGGHFVTANLSVSKEGYFLGQTTNNDNGGASMWDSFQRCWDQLQTEQGLIDEEERLAVSFPNYYRTTDEFLQGIAQCPDLQLVSVLEQMIRCPYREQYRLHKDDSTTTTKITPMDYAKAFVPTTRTWSHSTFKNALHKNRSEEEKERILEQFWKNYEELVASDPERHGMDYVHTYLVIKKV